jgi:hypothetical protein
VNLSNIKIISPAKTLTVRNEKLTLLCRITMSLSVFGQKFDEPGIDSAYGLELME